MLEALEVVGDGQSGSMDEVSALAKLFPNFVTSYNALLSALVLSPAIFWFQTFEGNNGYIAPSYSDESYDGEPSSGNRFRMKLKEFHKR